MSSNRTTPDRFVSVEEPNVDHSFEWPETGIVHEGIVENRETGEILSFRRAPGKHYVTVERRRRERPLSSILTAPPPALINTANITSLATPHAGGTTFRVTKPQAPDRHKEVSMRQKAEHHELVMQTRSRIGDPRAAVSRLMENRFGQSSPEEVDDFLDERLGHRDGCDGR